MPFILAYLKIHLKGIYAFFLFCMIFILLFALYQIPLAAVAYGTAVCTFIGLIFLFFDYRKFCKKHRRLIHLKDEIKITTQHLPAPEGAIEADYQRVIQSLFDDKQKITNEMNSRYEDLADYYTTWVHQIKTPIAAMRINLQGEDTQMSRELLEELFRIEQYVEMVLTYLRLDAGSTDYIIREYDLDGIVRQAVHKFAPQFIRRKLKLSYNNLNCKVLTDEKWLLFVIEQVLSNALKYTRYGTISIELEAPKILCIKDTGIGIAPEDLPRVFEKGYTGYNGRSDKKASGIGLYLCRRICENLGHRITINSCVDEGTAIRIDLRSTTLEIE